jgi:hypothetical protein
MQSFCKESQIRIDQNVSGTFNRRWMLGGEPGMEGRHRMSSVRFALGLLLLYAALAVAFTWPLARDWQVAIPEARHRIHTRPSGDMQQYLWNVWWFHRAVEERRNPFECPLLFHPQGALLYFDTLTLWNGALAYPFVDGLGLVRAANLMLLLNLVLGALAASALGAEVTGSRGGALVTGLAFGFSPFVFGRLNGGVWNFYAVAPLALGAWLLVRLARRPGAGRAMALGAGLLAAGLSEYTYLLFLLLLCGLMAAAAALGKGPAGASRRRFLAGLAGAGALLCLGMSPILSGAWKVYRLGGQHAVQRPREPIFAADLADYLTPSQAHPLLRAWRAYGRFVREHHLHRESRPWPGLAVVALAVLGLRARKSWPEAHAAWWAAAAAGAFVLSLGWSLRVLGHELFPLFYGLLDPIPVLGYVRCPARYAVVVQLALAVLAGLGAVELARRRGRAWLGLAALLVVFEFLPAPIPLTHVEPPAAVRALAAETGPGALWELSLGTREQLLYQTIHGRPIVDGYYSRLWTRDRIPAQTLTQAARGAMRGDARSERLLCSLLDAWGIGYVLVAPTVNRTLGDFLDRAAWLERRFSQDGWSLYRVGSAAPSSAGARSSSSFSTTWYAARGRAILATFACILRSLAGSSSSRSSL